MVRRPPTVKPTRISVLAVFVVAAGGVAYLVLELSYASLPPLPATAPVLLAMLAIVEAIAAYSVKSRLAGKPRTKPIMPIAVARMAALAKASALVSALALGGYLAAVAYTAPNAAHPGPSRDLTVAVSGVLATAFLLAAAVFLERSCRAPRVPPVDSQDLGPG